MLICHAQKCMHACMQYVHVRAKISACAHIKQSLAKQDCTAQFVSRSLNPAMRKEKDANGIPEIRASKTCKEVKTKIEGRSSQPLFFCICGQNVEKLDSSSLFWAHNYCLLQYPKLPRCTIKKYNSGSFLVGSIFFCCNIICAWESLT